MNKLKPTTNAKVRLRTFNNFLILDPSFIPASAGLFCRRLGVFPWDVIPTPMH
jgi:hypothetical protein